MTLSFSLFLSFAYPFKYTLGTLYCLFCLSLCTCLPLSQTHSHTYTDTHHHHHHQQQQQRQQQKQHSIQIFFKLAQAGKWTRDLFILFIFLALNHWATVAPLRALIYSKIKTWTMIHIILDICGYSTLSV
jgi:hypothetical protein